MSYIGLGSRWKFGAADSTGENTGNWTIAFTPADLNVNMPYFEVYKMVISGAPGSSMDVFVEGNQWDTTIAADLNSWDPVQPLQMRPGESLYMYWSDPVTDNTPPLATIWLRYDQDIQANKSAAYG